MSALSYDDVRKILAIIEDSTVDELHVEFGDFKLDVRRRGGTQPQEAAAIAAPLPPLVTAAGETQLGPGQFAVVAPMLGTFYRAPSPDVPPFIEAGTLVAPDDPLCIIDVLKLTNTIKAKRAGRVAAILAENATMVEYGQTLIVFDPQ